MLSIEERLCHIEGLLTVLVERQQERQWYNTAEVARIVGKAEYTVREWARLGRIRIGRAIVLAIDENGPAVVLHRATKRELDALDLRVAVLLREKLTRDIDNRRILWAAEDIIRNRPALSRWHPDYKDEFAEFLTLDAPFRR